MKKLLILLSLLLCFAFAETRIYRQVKSVSVHQTGKVMESRAAGDLFEITLSIGEDKVYKTHTRRLDKDNGRNIHQGYSIRKDRQILSSTMGEGGNAIVAIANSGSEVLEIGEEFMFSSRNSKFSQVITGVYKRIK